jgi:hypothetical protein
MKLHSLSIKVVFFVSIMFGHTNQTYAKDSNKIPIMKVLWQKEVAADANLCYSPNQVIFDKTTDKLLIASISFHSLRSKDSSEGKSWLLEVDPHSGDIVKRSFLKNITGSKATVISAPLLISSLTVSENNDITVVGKFDNSVKSIMKVNRRANTSKSIEFYGKSNAINKNSGGEDFSLILSGINLSGGNLLLIGGDRDKGLIIKVDSEGTRLWDRSYRIGQGQVDLFTDGLAVGNRGEFIIVGCSTKVSGKFPAATGDDFILQCNAQGDVIAKDIFTGNPWPGEQPRVCQLSRGNFVVVYGKGMELKHSDVNIRAYSPDLKLLWEKPIVKSEENKPSSFKIAATPKNGFILAANIDFGNLRVYEYDENGNQVANLSKDKEVWLGNIGLACMDKKALVVFQTRPSTGQGEELSRIKIIALELK